MMSLKTTKTSRGNLAVQYENFNFRKDRTLSTGDVNWRCLDRKCTASLKTCASVKKLLSKSGHHNHTPPVNSSPATKQSPVTPTQTPPAVPQTPTTDTSTRATETPSLTELLSPYTTLTPAPPKYQDQEAENQYLRQRLAELEYMTEALTNKAIDLEKELLQLRNPQEERLSKTPLQTENMQLLIDQDTPPITLTSLDQETQTDQVKPTFATSFCQTEAVPVRTDQTTQSDLSICNQTNQEVCVSAHVSLIQSVNSSVNENCENNSCVNSSVNCSLDNSSKSRKMLTDAEVWNGLKRFSSDKVFVLPPTLGLVIQFCKSWEVHAILPEDLKEYKLIIVPVSNARPVVTSSVTENNLTKNEGFNNEGSHWSLVVVHVSQGLFVHLDSLSPLNQNPAYNVCKQLNFVLDFQTLKVENQPCVQQKDSVSCGHEVLKNAQVEVNKCVQKLKSKIVNHGLSSGKPPRLTSRRNVTETPLELKNRFSALCEVLDNSTDCTSVKECSKANKSKPTLKKQVNVKSSNVRSAQKDTEIKSKQNSNILDESSTTQPEHTGSAVAENQTIRLFTDSHGRGVASLIDFEMAKCKVRGDIIPNGKTRTILGTARPLLKELGTNVNLVIMCGTNDLGNTASDSIVGMFHEFLNTPSKCRIFVMGLPLRRDIADFHREIVSINNQLKELCSKHNHASFVSLSHFHRRLFTRHGLHLNPAGKRALVGVIVRALFPSTSPTSSKQTLLLHSLASSSKPFFTKVYHRSYTNPGVPIPQSNAVPVPTYMDLNSITKFPPLRIPSRVFHRSKCNPSPPVPSLRLTSQNPLPTTHPVSNQKPDNQSQPNPSFLSTPKRLISTS